MLDLIIKNKEMLKNGSYKPADERTMLRIDSLDNPNYYDLYLIACCLANYPIEEKSEARELRQKYFELTNNGSIEGFEHSLSDYKETKSSHIICKNTGRVNKYGLYEFEINSKDSGLISDLWSAKSRDCLKYVDSKSYADKIIVSVGRNQFNNFINLLNTFMINYDDTIDDNLFFKNKSKNTLVDYTKLTLPFEPYDYQIEDAKKIVAKKRALIGHEMGCGKTFISVLVGSSINESKQIEHKNSDLLDYDDIIITNKGPLPIGKIVEENIDCKIQVFKDGKTEFVDILDRNCVDV